MTEERELERKKERKRRRERRKMRIQRFVCLSGFFTSHPHSFSSRTTTQ